MLMTTPRCSSLLGLYNQYVTATWRTRELSSGSWNNLWEMCNLYWSNFILEIKKKQYGSHAKLFFCFPFDSDVGIAMGYRLDDPGSIPNSARFFFSPQRPDQLWGPPSLLSNGYRGGEISSGVKRQGHEANHSPRSTAEVKNGGAIPPLPHISSWHSA
jgi:hypothetical protein